MTDQFRSLLLQLESEHNRQLTEQAMDHAAEIAKLKDRIKELERKDALDKLAAIGQEIGDYGDGWIEWAGGECPIPDAKAGEFSLKMRGGEGYGAVCNSDAPDMYWEHDGKYYDIIAYRLQQGSVLKGANKC